METGAFRELLAADVAVELGVLTAAEAGSALAKYWESRDESLAARLGPEDRARVEAEVARILSEAGGDVQAAVQKRGVHRELPASLGPRASHALSEAGARLRAPLRAMDKKRYVGFLPLGEGGMGVVYLALDSELNRRVAFKMIRSSVTDPLADDSGPISDDLVARFLQEAVVTGGLEHPGIVPVYELGITPSGAPYYTMRLVRGERTLDAAISQAKTQQDRLALLEPFLKTCDAVGYAHSRGVIHRDLKPANIALGQFGEVVVLDWGLAKMHQRPDLAGSRWQTRLDELRDTTDLKTLTSALGTPGYMAPEAALGEVDKIDERADIYSLGAILHRILTGKFPFAFDTFPEYVAQLMRGIQDVPNPPGLGRICLQALATKRKDRFSGVGELADAVRAWQNESAVDREVEALQAEAEAALRTAEGLAGDALLGQLDGVIAVVARILDLRPGHEEAEALADGARALRADAIAQAEGAARKRLLRRVGVVGLLTATAATIVVALLLNTKREEAENARARAEDLAGFMLHDLHEGLVPVGRLDLLASVARKSLDYYSSLPTEDITDDVRRARALVLRRIGEVLQDTGELAGALQSYQQSKPLWEAVDDQYELSKLLNQVGDVLQETGDLDGALALYRRSADIRRKLGRQADLPRSVERIADVLMRKGDRRAARELYDESLAVRRALALKEPDNAEHERDLAISLEKHGDLAIGNLATARRFFEESLVIRRKRLAEEPGNAERQNDVASCIFRVGHCQAAAGEGEAARESFGEALALYRRLVQTDPTHAWHQRNLALTLENLGHYEEALEVKRGLAARDPSNTRARHDVCASLINMGAREKDKKDFSGAMARFTEALAIARKLTEENPDNTEWKEDLSDVLVQMGDVYQATKRAQQAQESYEEAQAIQRRLVETDPESAKWQRALAVVLDKLGQYEESLEIRRALHHLDATNVRWQRDLVWGLGRMGNQKKDPKYYEEALPVHRKLPESPSQQRELSFCLYSIGTLYEAKGELEKALEALREAEAVHRTAQGYEKEHRWWADAYFRVGYNAACAAAVAGNQAVALKRLEENLSWCRAHLGKDRLAAHLEHARTNDPDLKSLRGLPAFDELFR